MFSSFSFLFISACSFIDLFLTDYQIGALPTLLRIRQIAILGLRNETISRGLQSARHQILEFNHRISKRYLEGERREGRDRREQAR